ncbi:hypothetical protein LCGC14_2797920 [marine sediment metagenome]|uniref:Uncharacterized protein n=1 Tax=marine sediment metagenome TaxID=412755 RepID=A0A0F8ZAP0_9ZZZZ|nr:hypothetical protein [bacterium]
MVTSLLYYRTPATKQSDVADPRNLPTAQILEFTQPSKVLEGIKELYGNIITKQASVNQSGVRRIFNRDDGMKNRDFTVMGVINKTPVTDAINRIMDFRTRLQRDDNHIHGIIGFLSGNSTNFNVDPDAQPGNPVPNVATKGLMIGETEIGYEGRLFTRLTFRMNLHFGGQHETVTVS